MLRTFLKEVLDFINKAVRPLVVFTILLFFFFKSVYISNMTQNVASCQCLQWAG